MNRKIIAGAMAFFAGKFDNLCFVGRVCFGANLRHSEQLGGERDNFEQFDKQFFNFENHTQNLPRKRHDNLCCGYLFEQRSNHSIGARQQYLWQKCD